MKGLPAQTDFVVIGAGIAGLRAAIELAESGHVLLLTKKGFPTFKSRDAKSEAEWLSDDDDVILHLQDTLEAGAGLCNPAAVKILIEEGAERIDELLGWGKPHST
ncbi:MAG TPA: FAD-binding protein, partial [Candidatus Udaeobacter sp.]|nr:FAD-binding protein [Candidatus Udaeobacter sp.]